MRSHNVGWIEGGTPASKFCKGLIFPINCPKSNIPIFFVGFRLWLSMLDFGSSAQSYWIGAIGRVCRVGYRGEPAERFEDSGRLPALKTRPYPYNRKASLVGRGEIRQAYRSGRTDLAPDFVERCLTRLFRRRVAAGL